MTTDQTAPARTYWVELADLGRDRDDILDLWARHIPGLPFPRERYVWEYQDNPCGPARCWFLVVEPGTRRVGTCGIVPRRVQIGGDTVLAGRASLLAVDAEHRFLGPALTLARTILASIGHEGLTAIFTVAPPKAAGVFKQLLMKKPDDLVALYNLGSVYVDAKTNLDEAEAAFKRCLAEGTASRGPEEATVRWRLGLAYDLQGKTDSALVELRKAVELAPGVKQFKDALKQVEKKK